ncbi:MAG TPA: hypothetical protein VGD13_03760 [Xanthobacteraceae bacterium]
MRFILRHVIDDDRLAALSNFIADGGFDLQLTARLKTELNVIAYSARDPAIFGDARDSREAHAGDPAYNFQNSRHCIDALDGSHVRLEVHQLT